MQGNLWAPGELEFVFLFIIIIIIINYYFLRDEASLVAQAGLELLGSSSLPP